MLLIQRTPECSAGVLCGVPEYEKAVMCLTEKMFVLDRPHPVTKGCRP